MIDCKVKLYEAKVLADSVSYAGVRLTTLVVNMPRIILAEFNTHRVFSRNSASSRAIPVEKRIKMIEEDPYIPLQFGRNKSGMQSTEILEESEAVVARQEWIKAMHSAIGHARELAKLEVHKQFANRLLEPFSPHTVIVSSTEWENMYALRIHPDAQPEFHKVAAAIHAARDASYPEGIDHGESYWHLPLIDRTSDDAKLSLMDQIKVSAGRCARVSYVTHDGVRDPSKDIELHDRLLSSGHMSPLEHQATPLRVAEICVDCEELDTAFRGNFRGWNQYRKMIPGEDVFRKLQTLSRCCNASLSGQLHGKSSYNGLYFACAKCGKVVL